MIEVANEIPVLSTILYYEINCLLLILGFTLFTTLINVILVLSLLMLVIRNVNISPLNTQQWIAEKKSRGYRVWFG